MTKFSGGELIPLDWGAQLSLSLQVDEAPTLNPGVALNKVDANAINFFDPGNTVTTPQSFSFGFGGTLSSTATRIDKFDPYYSIKDLMKPDNPKTDTCRDENDILLNPDFLPTRAKSSPFILESDLGIKDWLYGTMFVDQLLPSSGALPQPQSGGGGAAASGASGASGGGSSSGKDTVTYEIKFAIVSSGNVTPTWKLVRVSANTGSSPFFMTGRTRTHDLIITIGPSTQQTNNTHLASQIGNAVSNANRALLTPP